MKHALIIGISGQDGAYLAKLLLAKGYRVSGTSRDRTVFPANLNTLGVAGQVELIDLDLGDLSAVTAVLEQQAPNEIYHLAGQSSVGLSFTYPHETFVANATGVGHLLEAVRRLRSPVRICMASSGECFGDNGGLPAGEQAPMRPRSPYAAAKAAAFWQTAVYREAYGIFASSAILYNHESPLRPAAFVTAKIIQGAVDIHCGRARQIKLGNLDIIRDWGWAEEYVEVMHMMLQYERPDDFIVATGRSYPLREFVVLAFASLGLDWRDHVISDSGFLRPTDIPVCRADPGKAASRLGWRATISMPGVVERLLQAALSRESSSHRFQKRGA